MFRRVVRDNIINIVSISVEKLDIIPAESLLRGPHAQPLLLPNNVYIYKRKCISMRYILTVCSKVGRVIKLYRMVVVNLCVLVPSHSYVTSQG